ncbi:hypothetical protein ECANGB1_1133 [Enterospora canceri]|uniref:Uncharacterized protein n=1 Tax=Enterospora canceri TaxID=1081671 RepID=A0A1Y1S7G1_9MICR|nr:hypothetical protein ECANGB1_1133 [Enterospora canceri]
MELNHILLLSITGTVLGSTFQELYKKEEENKANISTIMDPVEPIETMSTFLVYKMKKATDEIEITAVGIGNQDGDGVLVKNCMRIHSDQILSDIMRGFKELLSYDDVKTEIALDSMDSFKDKTDIKYAGFYPVNTFLSDLIKQAIIEAKLVFRARGDHREMLDGWYTNATLDIFRRILMKEHFMIHFEREKSEFRQQFELPLKGEFMVFFCLKIDNNEYISDMMVGSTEKITTTYKIGQMEPKKPTPQSDTSKPPRKLRNTAIVLGVILALVILLTVIHLIVRNKIK